MSAKNIRPARITPARAGKTLLSSRHLCREQDHPRACGENMFPRCGVSASIGSPPRVRGKPQTIRIAVGYVRITPARAGKTCLSKSAGLMPRDHPRACGENTATPQQTGAARGSPPRVRGKRPARAAEGLGIRITPARAGKTEEDMGNAGTEKDHPRACGENRREGRRVRWKRGSPPRVRGKHLAEVEEGKAERITPARAGKTPRKSDRRAARRDHPRACGENARSRASARCEAGSPPRVRGKLLFLGVALCAHRITPARAGKTGAADG